MGEGGMVCVCVCVWGGGQMLICWHSPYYQCREQLPTPIRRAVVVALRVDVPDRETLARVLVDVRACVFVRVHSSQPTCHVYLNQRQRPVLNQHGIVQLGVADAYMQAPPTRTPNRQPARANRI